MLARRRNLLSSILLWPMILGCGDDDPGPPVVIDPPEGYATSATEAVILLRNAYLTLDLTRLDKVLHDDFAFELSESDADTLGIGSGWDRSTHMTWSDHLFSGEPGIRADGTVQTPVDPSFGLEVSWLPEGEWTPAAPGGGPLERTYESLSSVQYFMGDLDFIEGRQTFHVVEAEVAVGDAVTHVFQVVHWTSTPPGALSKHSTISWGRLIAKFRFETILEAPADYAGTALEAIQMLADAYRQRDLPSLDRLLHEDFVFELAALDADTLEMSPSWDEASHRAWTENLFTGQPGERADGTPQAPLDPAAGITGAWNPVGGVSSWALVSQGPLVNTLQQSFEGDWQVGYLDGDFDQVAGYQTFNVVERVLAVGDEWARVHQLVRWASSTPGAEQPLARKGETLSFGRLIAKFRFDASR